MDGVMGEVVKTSLAPRHEADCKKEGQTVRLVEVDLPCRQDHAPVPRNCTTPPVSANVQGQHNGWGLQKSSKASGLFPASQDVFGDLRPKLFQLMEHGNLVLGFELQHRRRRLSQLCDSRHDRCKICEGIRLMKILM